MMVSRARRKMELVDKAYGRERDIVIDYNKCVVHNIKQD